MLQACFTRDHLVINKRPVDTALINNPVGKILVLN